MKKRNRVIAASLSALFLSQILIGGSGNNKGLLHPENIAYAIDSIKLKINADELKEDFKENTAGLGEIDFFDVAYGNSTRSKKRSLSSSRGFGDNLTVSGTIMLGNVDGYETSDDQPIRIIIFDGNWTPLVNETYHNGDQYSVSVSASGSDVFHVKYECDGYLPAILRNIGTGSFVLGSNGSADTLTLVPGNSTFRNDENDYWNEENLTADDAQYVRTFIGAQEGTDDYQSYMDKNADGEIDEFDAGWFESAYSGNVSADMAIRKTMRLESDAVFEHSLDLHDTSLDLNGYKLTVEDCMSFSTENPSLWENGEGAVLDINGGFLEIKKNFVFRTASPDGWGCPAGQKLKINGGILNVEGQFDFGQVHCYDEMIMTNSDDLVFIGGNWNYVTDSDMEGKWTAGKLYFLGQNWNVNEESGPKSIFSSGTHSITFYYPYGKQTVLWDNPVPTVSNPDGTLNTQRRFNFDYENGLVFPYGFTEDLYYFRPSWRDYDAPDYSRYRKSFAASDGTDVATGNYSKSFTDFSITSPGVHADFMRTYNSMNEEEGSFGKGWDFNVDVSKIVFPAYGYYQVVLPDGSNTTFKDDGNGGFECMNAHSRMERNGNEYTVTNSSNAKYHFNAEGRLDEVQDASGNTLLISDLENNVRYVTDSTGRRYSIHYTEINGKKRIDSITDNCDAPESEQRSVSYQYDNDGRLTSFTNVSGGAETYEYDGNGYLCKIIDCYGETVEEAGYLDHGELSCIINSSGLKQQYKYDKAEKTTNMDEYDGNTLLKSYFYSYDESCALKTTEVSTAGQLFTLNKIKYTQTDGRNRYNEIREVTDIKGNTTSYERDGNGNVTKVVYADGSFSLTRYNDKNMPVIQSDECGYITITRYDDTGIKAVREYNKFLPVSDPEAFVNSYSENMALSENDYSVTEYTYASVSETGGIKGLVKTVTTADNVTVEYCYSPNGYAKGLPVTKYVKSNNNIIAKTTYEYNEQLQPSVERVYADISHNITSVKEFEYDAFSNLIEVRDYGIGNVPKVSITEYDLLSRKTADYSPLWSADRSHATTYTYYPNGKIKTVTDVMGHTVSYNYNKYGQLISTTYPDGTIDVIIYDELDRVAATGFKADVSSPLQYLTSVDYAFEEHEYNIITPNGSREATYKGLRTNKHTYISGSKRINSSVLTDLRGNNVEEKINDQIKLTSVYYENGQLAKKTDANGNDTLYEYGKFGLLTKSTVPLSDNSSSVAVNSYDDCGRLVMSKKLSQAENETDAKWIISENTYDAFGNLSQTTLKNSDSGEKSITRYFYNDMGIQTSMQTGLSSEDDQDYLTTYFHYDNWFRSIRKTDSTGYDSGTVEYDLDNNVISSTDTIGNSSVYTYDLLGRVLNVDTTNAADPSKNVEASYTYDIMGRVKTATTHDVTTSYEYDKLGRKYSETESSNNNSVFRGFFYEGVSSFLRREITGRYHLIVYSSKEYEYDDEMRLQTVKENGSEVVSYSYDAVGNKLTETLGNGVVSNYSYNRLNKITNIETALDGNELSNYQYFYNLDGSDYCKIRTEGGIIEETSYGYDGLNRLVSESVAVNDNVTDTYSYEYDDYGNRSRMTASGTENYSTVYNYNDAQGNYTGMLQKETKTAAPSTVSSTPSVKETNYTYDANGNLVGETSGSTTKTYTYNGINQLIGYTDGNTTAAYTYNSNGLRIEKTVNGQRINHIWDGSGQIVADINDGSLYNAKCYIRGTGLAAKYDFVNGLKTGYTYYLQNAHGDVDALLDDNGAVTKTYHYDAFGVEKDIDDNDMNAFRYCGEYYDKETATIYLRARYYNPSNGRFNSRDTFAGRSGDPLSLNLYTYCKNNPVKFIDPSGHDTVEAAAFAAKNPRPTKVNSPGDAKILKQWDDKYNRLLNSPPSVNSASDAAMYTSLRKEVTVLPKINSQSDVKAYATEIKEHNIWRTLEAEKKAAADKRKAEAAARAAEKARAERQKRFDDRLAAVPAPSCKEYYDTMDEAAIDFVLMYNERSINEWREYDARIDAVNVNGETKYVLGPVGVGKKRDDGYGNPTYGGEGAVIDFTPDSVAFVHTHAQYYGDLNDSFSGFDKGIYGDAEYIKEYNKIGYVGTPKGEVLRMTPEAKNRYDADTIFENAPFDPNHDYWKVD